MKRTNSMVERSKLDDALAEFSEEVEVVAALLARRAASGGAAKAEGGARLHPTAYIETLTAAVSLPPGCLFVGHTNTDMDSVGGAVGAAELYDGRACLAQPPSELNGEIMYAISYARTGEKPDWAGGEKSETQYETVVKMDADFTQLLCSKRHRVVESRRGGRGQSAGAFWYRCTRQPRSLR